MSFFTKSMLEESIYEAKYFENAAKYKSVSDYDEFDIFLSHSYDDRIYIRKLKEHLESEFNLSCYVDWLCEPQKLKRHMVSKETAAILRQRMKQSKSLVFCTSKSSANSKWMPWELGYFDALKGLVAILPITEYRDDRFQGQEYLGLYPYVDLMTDRRSNLQMWVNEASDKYVNMSAWLKGEKPYIRS